MQNIDLNQRLALRLGYAGVLPFLLLMAGCWTADTDWLGAFIKGQLAYGIAVLSFLGGVHWGVALLAAGLTPEQTRRALVWSVVPALVAWFATMTGGFGFAVLMAGFFAAYRADKHLYAWYRMPAWLIELRLRLTCAVIAALALTVIAANVRG